MTEGRFQLPAKGRAKADILAAMSELRQKDVKWREGKVFSLVFDAGDQVTELLKEAYLMFFSENGLNPTAFPSLRELETQVVAMTATLPGGARGFITAPRISSARWPGRWRFSLRSRRWAGSGTGRRRKERSCSNNRPPRWPRFAC